MGPLRSAIVAERVGAFDPAVAAEMVRGTKVYGRGETAVRALDEVTVGFAARAFTSIMGPSGSGKSTLLHCLAGLDDLTSGEVWLGDIDIARLNERARTRIRRDRIGFVFQGFNLVPTLDARENIAPERSWFDSIVGRFGLGDRLAHRPSELSGGQQQRVAVARALVMRPDLVLADEPTGNLDSKSGADVLRLLRDAVDEFGQTVVMVTHDAAAASYSDRVVFLADGRLVSELVDPTPSRILDEMKALGG
jgi:putative ABC transport system ATP-binding protein